MNKETIQNFVQKIKDVPIIYKIILFFGVCIVMIAGFIGSIVGYEVWMSKKTGKSFQFFSLFKIPNTPVTPAIINTKDYNKYGNLELVTGSASGTVETDSLCKEKCDKSTTCTGYYYDVKNKKCEIFDNIKDRTLNVSNNLETSNISQLLYLVTPKDRISMTKWVKNSDIEIDISKNPNLKAFMSFKSPDTIDHDMHINQCKNLCRDNQSCTGFSVNKTLNTCDLYNNIQKSTLDSVTKSSISTDFYTFDDGTPPISKSTAGTTPCTKVCANGGTLNATNCICGCTAGFTGDLCQTAVAATPCTKVCANGGTLNATNCTCGCTAGFTGDLCQTPPAVPPAV